MSPSEKAIDGEPGAAATGQPNRGRKNWLAGFIGVLIGLIAVALIIGRGSACKPGVFGQWHHDCSMIFHSVDAPITPDAKPAKLAVTYDGKVIRVLAGMALEDYSRFFTDAPPTILKLQGVKYVADGLFFNGSSAPVLRVNGDKTLLEWDGKPQWRVAAQATDLVMSALRTGAHLEVEYSSRFHGRGQQAVVSSAGFSEALKALSGGSD